MKLHQQTKHKMSLLCVCILGIGIVSSMLVLPSTDDFSSQFDIDAANVTILSADYYSNHNFVIPILGDYSISWALSQTDGIYGDFEVTVPSSGVDQIIDFFICDQANFDLWDSGETASVYHNQDNVGSYSFNFRVPYADTWHFVFKNYALFLSKTINLDLYRDQTPPSIDMNLDAGATYSGIKEITATIAEAQFDISDVRLYIDGSLVDTETDSSFSYSWDTTQYTNGAHTIRISSSDNVGNSGYEEITVLVSNVVPGTIGSTAPGTTGGGGNGGGSPPFVSPIMLVALLGIVGLIVVVGIVGRGRGRATALPTTGDFETAKSTQTTPVREREIVSERFLVICPFCGGKNEQGTISCQSCGAKL